MTTYAQIKKIHTLKNVLQLDDDLDVDMLMSFGVQSSKNLTTTEAGIFLEILEEKAVLTNKWEVRNKKYEELKSRDEDMATPAQLRMIEAMWREVCYVDSPEFAKQSLRKFIQNKFKIADIKFLTKKKAVKVIRSISAMKQKLIG